MSVGTWPKHPRGLTQSLPGAWPTPPAISSLSLEFAFQPGPSLALPAFSRLFLPLILIGHCLPFHLRDLIVIVLKIFNGRNTAQHALENGRGVTGGPQKKCLREKVQSPGEHPQGQRQEMSLASKATHPLLYSQPRNTLKPFLTLPPPSPMSGKNW